MTKTATAYGGALYELARDEQLADEILQQLRVLATVFQTTPDYMKLLCTPSISKQERCAVLQHDFGGKVHPYVLNFMKLLTERGLMREFPACCTEYRHRFNEDHAILEATAVTAVALHDDLQQKLVKKLSEVTGKTIDLTNKIDPTVLGGIRLEMDGTQLDGTIRHRLDNVRTLLHDTVL